MAAPLMATSYAPLPAASPMTPATRPAIGGSVAIASRLEAMAAAGTAIPQPAPNRSTKRPVPIMTGSETAKPAVSMAPSGPVDRP